MKRIILFLVGLLALTGCATKHSSSLYQEYAGDALVVEVKSKTTAKSFLLSSKAATLEGQATNVVTTASGRAYASGKSFSGGKLEQDPDEAAIGAAGTAAGNTIGAGAGAVLGVP